MEEGGECVWCTGGRRATVRRGAGRRRRGAGSAARSRHEQKEACARKHTEGVKRGAGGRNGRGGGPSSGGKHAAAMGSARGVGSACESAGGAGRGARTWEGRQKSAACKDSGLQNEGMGW